MSIQDQRLRLMRSTRKLGAILGTTPLIDSSDCTPGRLALKIASPSSTQPLPRPLVLRLQSVPPTTPTMPLSPISPLFATFHANTSSTLDSTLGVETRRRKMAKLTRTLGENIPPELVFPSSSAMKQRRHRSSSVGSLAHLVASAVYSLNDEKELLISKDSNKDAEAAKPLPPTPTVLKKPHLHLTSSIKRSSSLQSPPTRPIRTRSKTLTRAANQNSSHSHSHSVAAPSIGAFPIPPPVQKEDWYDYETGYHLVRTDSASAIPGDRDLDQRLSRPSLEERERERREKAFGRRKEREWSGEWNHRDMAVVRSQLRGLRA